MALLSFPNDRTAFGGRPFISFKPKEGGELIFLPIPAGITFEDGGTFSTINLGVLGGAAQNIANEGAGPKKAGKMLLEASVTASAKAVGKLASNEFAEELMFATKKVVNPNTNTTFAGNTVRNFQFQFTLVGRSQQDSIIIRDIHNTFRNYMYPETTKDSSSIILDYPTTWEIKFHQRGRRGINTWIPKIHESYLTTLSTSFNPSANMYRVDGSPAEIQFTLSFQETRALNRLDIEKYKAG